MKWLQLLFFSLLLPLPAEARLGLHQKNAASRALILEHDADIELKKMAPDSNQKAIGLLEKATTAASFRRLTLEGQLRIWGKLSATYECAGNFDAAEKLITSLAANPNFTAFSITLEVSHARMLLRRGRLLEAAGIIGKLAKIEGRAISLKDRTEIRDALTCLEEATREKTAETEALIQKGFYKEALAPARMLYTMAQKKLFAKSTSPKWREIHYCLACHMLATCYLFGDESERALEILRTQHSSAAFPEIQELIQGDLFAAACLEGQYGHKEEACLLFATFCDRVSVQNPLFAQAAIQAAEYALDLKNYDLFHAFSKKLLLSPYALEAELLAAEELYSLGKREESSNKLEALAGTSLNKKVLLLKGSWSAARGEFQKAVDYLVACLAHPSGDWPETCKTHLLLANSYLELARDSEEPSSYFEKAESSFTACSRDDRIVGLAKTYLARYFRSQDSAEKTRLGAFIQDNMALLSPRAKESLELLRQELADKSPSEGMSAKSAKLEALHELRKEHYSEAIAWLKKAQEAGLRDEEVIETLLLIPTDDAASYLLTLTEGASLEHFIALGRLHPEGAIEELSALASKGSPTPPDLRHLLATLYMKVDRPDLALSEITTLTKEFPTYARRDHLLFLEAELREGIDCEKARMLRKELGARYPTSEYAPESAFREFPEKEYELRHPLAINHLIEILRTFGKSPFAIPCHYYLGRADGHESAFHFHEADRLSSELKADIPEHYKNYFKEIEKASLLALGRLGDIPALQKLMLLFPQDTQAEASYLLAEAKLGGGQAAAARKELASLIEWHEKNKVETPFLAKSYYALAMEEKKMNQLQQAAEFLGQAEKSATQELLLEVRIAKSECLKEMERYDDAMVVLSRVINDNIASSLRLKAMFLRAEMYSLKKRHDLAIKQLEACAKKGGEWGKKAREKLENEYGYQ